MDNTIFYMKNELVDQLNTLVQHTEEIYLNFGRQYPDLQHEMQKSIRNANARINCNENQNNGSSNYIEQQTNTVVENTKDVIEQSGSSFTDIHNKDENLFEALEKGIQSLSNLEEKIEAIKEDSIEMELISINAMTVAIKAGNEGKAFSYITEELKRLSGKTITLTEDITTRGEKILEVFYNFRSSVRKVRTFQERLFGDFKQRLYQSLQELVNGVEQIIKTLCTFIKKSEQVKTPLNNIMQEIQLQDIIKQSVNHIIISLNEIKELETDSTEQELLDELQFFHSLPDLCLQLLEDVKEKIESSYRVFQENTDSIASIIKDVEDQRKNFLESLLGDSRQEGATSGSASTHPETGQDSKESLHSIFSKASSMLEDLFKDLSTALKQKGKIANGTKGLMNEVNRLEDNFKTFSTLVTRFHNIDISSRIEVAKTAVLHNMKGTVEEMNALTGRIEQDVSESLDVTKSFIEQTSGAINTNTKTFRHDEKVVSDFESTIHEKYQKLFDIKNELTEIVENFSLYTNRFFSLFHNTQNDLEKLQVLTDDINNIKEKLHEIKRQSQNEMEPILKKMGMSSWNIENSRLKEIIERFTIFTHKKTAGEMAGFEVEEGSPSGEFTLF